MHHRFIIFLLSLFFFQACFADKPADLMQAFCDAARHDPIYQGEVANYFETIQILPESIAAILPQVSLYSEAQRTYQKVYPGPLPFPTTATVNATLYTLSASQTVFNLTQFKQVEQAKYTVKSAFATLRGQQQDLMFRLARAYFDVLKKRDIYEFTQQQVDYLTQQLESTQALFEHNESTITELEQAKGILELFIAELHSTRLNYYDSIQLLSEITAVRYKEFARFPRDFTLIKPQPNNLSEWLKTSNEHNYFLRAARYNIAATREALYAVEGGFLPSVNAIGNLSREDAPNSVIADTQRTQLDSVGVNATWNIFQGGLTIAQTKAAAASLQQAYAEMRKQYLNAMATTRIAFRSIVLGALRVASIRIAMAANTLAIQNALEAYRSGEVTITEIIQIQQQLYTSQKQFAEYTYQYLLDLIYLKFAVGTLDAENLARINQWMIK